MCLRETFSRTKTLFPAPCLISERASVLGAASLSKRRPALEQRALRKAVHYRERQRPLIDSICEYPFSLPGFGAWLLLYDLYLLAPAPATCGERTARSSQPCGMNHARKGIGVEETYPANQVVMICWCWSVARKSSVCYVFTATQMRIGSIYSLTALPGTFVNDEHRGGLRIARQAVFF